MRRQVDSRGGLALLDNSSAIAREARLAAAALVRSRHDEMISTWGLSRAVDIN